MELLGEIEEDTVDYSATYDGQNSEPDVLPARFPNLLVNGGGGIAVGMATNIPPHNLGEIIDAAVHMVDNPDAKVPELMDRTSRPEHSSSGRTASRTRTQRAAAPSRCVRSPRSTTVAGGARRASS